jgi:hypothetical protein
VSALSLIVCIYYNSFIPEKQGIFYLSFVPVVPPDRRAFDYSFRASISSQVRPRRFVLCGLYIIGRYAPPAVRVGRFVSPHNTIM